MFICLFVDSPSLSGGLGTMRTSLTTVIATVTVTVTVTESVTESVTATETLIIITTD